MKELIEKYELEIEDLLLMSSIDQWTKNELSDLGYIEDRIQVHLENWDIS